MKTETINYTDVDGRSYLGYVAVPASPNGAAVLIGHNLPGIGDHERDVAQRLAELGYVALAADYHGEGRTLPKEEIKGFLAASISDPTALRAAMGAALAILTGHSSISPDRIAAIGYCFGGLAALELARAGANLAAIVGFHTSLPGGTVEEARAITGKVLILNAANDPYVPIESRILFEQQMNEAGIDWRMMLFGSTRHAFTVRDAAQFNMPDIGYNQRSDDRSWQMMRALFEETINQT